MDFILNRTWSTFYDYIHVYKMSIQYTNPFKRYRTETKSVTFGTDGTEGRTDGMDGRTDVCTDSGDTICTPIENGGGIMMGEEVFQLHVATPTYATCPVSLYKRQAHHGIFSLLVHNRVFLCRHATGSSFPDGV